MTEKEIEVDEVTGKILITVAAPSGWKACYLTSCDKSNGDARIIVRPIILWVTVEKERIEGGARYLLQEIRHFIVGNYGGVIDYEQYELPFLCVVEPGEDVDETAARAIAYRFTEENEKDVC